MLHDDRMTTVAICVVAVGDVSISLASVLRQCPHYDPDSSASWVGDPVAAPEYSVVRKWSGMTAEFEEYATRLSNALNEIGMVSCMTCADVVAQALWRCLQNSVRRFHPYYAVVLSRNG